MFGKQTTYKVLAIMPFSYMGGKFANKAIIGPFDHYRSASKWALGFENVAKKQKKEVAAVVFPENDHEGTIFAFHPEFATAYDLEVTPDELLTEAQQFVQMLKKMPLSM